MPIRQRRIVAASNRRKKSGSGEEDSGLHLDLVCVTNVGRTGLLLFQKKNVWPKLYVFIPGSSKRNVGISVVNLLQEMARTRPSRVIVVRNSPTPRAVLAKERRK